MGDGSGVAISFCRRMNTGVVCAVKVCVLLYDTKPKGVWKCAPCRVVHQLVRVLVSLQEGKVLLETANGA
ncbi:hypothetical protein QL285_059080 [Trifolium repens]|nr:hypothetical protein QL285_059080 [Trifolium repens]